jgi:hypothetical protein
MVDFALFMLEASGATIKAFNDAAAMIVDQSRSDLRVHDFSLAVGAAGITVHCSYDPPGEAMRRLEVHVEGRKYATRSDCWYGLFLNPDDGLPIAGVKLDFAWTEDAERAAIAATLPAQGKGRNLLAALRNSKRRSK